MSATADKRFAVALFALALAAPEWASACPSCAAREAVDNSRMLWVLAPMVLFPFVVALVVWRVFRRLQE